MKCVICEENCRVLHESSAELYPMVSGTTFESTGNYGSKHWDSEGRQYLQLVICNDCLPKKANVIDVVAWKQPLAPMRELLSRRPFQELRDEWKAESDTVKKEASAQEQKFISFLEENGYTLFIETRPKVLQMAMPGPTKGTYEIRDNSVSLKTEEIGTHVSTQFTGGGSATGRMTWSARGGTCSIKIDMDKEGWKQEALGFIQGAERPF